MAALPSGTVTFLFTDIEGSTERWERDPVTMAAAVNRQHALLSQVIAENGGVHFKTIGDALQAAFPTVRQALAAAVAGQRALQTEDWSAVGGLPVRMALHAGEAAPDERGDYLAAPLNRLSRLLSTGHGGQVLVSQAVEQLARDNLPAGATLDDLGEHRLRDLLEPERVFQVRHSDLPHRFPGLRSLDARHHNLPRQPTPFFGREREVREIVELMRSGTAQLLTLTGPGGTGKTRLAIQAASELLDDFADGVFLVELAPLTDPRLLPAVIAAALGLREEAGQSPRESVVAFLHDKRLLLVLDNFEHMLAAAPFVSDLLVAAPKVAVIATSRAPLRLRAERQYPVPPFRMPDAGAEADVEALAGSEAVRFFVERAQTASPAFTPAAETLPIIAAIVRRLDGLPLAIELAAARIRMLTPVALLARLEQRLSTHAALMGRLEQQLPLLAEGARDAPARHRTLRAAIAWSHDLLAKEDRVLFRRLAAFTGGFTLDAAEAIGSLDSDDVGDVLIPLESLVDHSLLRQGAMADGMPRFAMLQTIHEFAQDLLAASDELAIVQQRHAEFFLDLAEEANTHRFSEREGAWHDRLILEYPNIRAALQWFLDTRDGERLTGMAGALAGLWIVRGQHREGRTWLDAALATESSASTRLRCLYRASVLAEEQGDIPSSTRLAEETLDLAQRDGDAKELADAQRRLGQMLIVTGERDRGVSLLNDALLCHKSAGDAFGAADVLRTLAEVAVQQSDLSLARTCLEEAIERSRSVADERGVANGLFQLALLALGDGDGDRAIALMEDAAHRWRQTNTMASEAMTRVYLGILFINHLGDDARAEALLTEALQFWREAGHSAGVATILVALGHVARQLGDLDRAEAFLQEALALISAMDPSLVPVGTSLRAEHELGQVALARGDRAQAMRCYRASLERLRAIPREEWASQGLMNEGLSGVAAESLRLVAQAAADSSTECAARLLGAAPAIQAAAHFPLLRAEQSRVEQVEGDVRQRLSGEDFARAWADGEAFSVEDALDEALRLTVDTVA